MKVALCLSGHLRSYEAAYPTLKKAILDQFNPDIFIFTWDTIGFDGANRGDEHLVDTPVDPGRLRQLYLPKKLMIKPGRRWNTLRYHRRMGQGMRNPEVVCGMFYGIFKANALRNEFERKNHFTYDAVIRGRADLSFQSILEPKEILHCQVANGIYFPNFGDYKGVNDQFAFGNSASMNIYSGIYQNLNHFFNLGCRWHPESLTKFNIDYFNLPIFRSSIIYDILRANGSIFRQY